MPKSDNRPFPLVLEVEFLDRLSEPVREKRAKSISEIVRVALERYDFSNVVVVRPAQLTISVRLPAAIRKTLQKVAREKHTSVGQLVRSAVESYLPEIEGDAAGQLALPIPHVELPPEQKPAVPPPAKPARRAKPRPAPPPKKSKSAPAKGARGKRRRGAPG